MVDIKYSNSIKERTKNFPLCPESKKPNEKHFSEYMLENMPDKYKPHQKIICDQTDKLGFICHYGS